MTSSFRIHSSDPVPTPQPFILTLKLDQTTFKQVDQLRQQHFPPERNFIPAHITLFHALPGDQQPALTPVLQTLCSQTPRLTLQFPLLRFLGKGVAIEVHSPALVQVQQSLKAEWIDWLNRQDQQRYRPHITIQNKVAPDTARQLYEQLGNEWKPFDGYGEGLLLWRYQGGPWALVDEFPFATQPN